MSYLYLYDFTYVMTQDGACILKSTPLKPQVRGNLRKYLVLCYRPDVYERAVPGA